ncbi:PD-(D/E)XK nuclease superfamily protein [Ruminococcaceae bacterium YRB3002]|nr:PD-(D/E)XK nuclease superfamily protein [Ruminococcaceae bacterium YRB3002]
MAEVYILNKIFDGSWNDIEGNISHEIIDFALTDSGSYFVYNVPYGVCPAWINIKDDIGYTGGSHEAEYLLLTSESRDKTFNILYRIKLIRKVHSIGYSRNWADDDQKKRAMASIYEQNQIYYGGRVITDLIDNTTPLVTFEAAYMEMPTFPIEISLSEYKYQRNKGYVKSDASRNDYNMLNKKLKESNWIRVGLDPIVARTDSNYSSKTFLNLILKNRSEECFTNMLYSVLNEPDMFQKFCCRFAADKYFDERCPFKVYREHKLIDGRLDICADNGYQRVVIENKLESGLNGLKRDSGSQLSTYYEWASEAESDPVCFITAPDYRISSSHSISPGQLGKEIAKYDPQMLDKYTLISYGEISDFIEENRQGLSENYEYSRYLDDIIAAFRSYSYPTKSSYYRSLLQERIK